MGHSQDEKTKSRARVLDVASRRFRERGLHALSIADVMTEAGLTQGGFYKHFGSREELVASAVDSAMTETLAKPVTTLEAFVDRYLSVGHRDATGTGCAMSALAADVARAGPRSRRVFTTKFRDALQRLSNLARDAGEDAGEEAAMVRVSAMMGALILARAVDDPELSAALLEATRLSVKPAPASNPVQPRRTRKGAKS